MIGGLWLTPGVWDATIEELAQRGHRAQAVSLPGQGDGRTDATLTDQENAVLAAIDAADRPLVVGHSAACTLAWLAADRRPDRIAGVALIGGMPSSEGEQYAAFFPIEDGAMPFPGWEPFAGPDSHDLDQQARDLIAGAAVAVPEGVAHGIVHYTDEARYAVPVTLICPEFSPEQAKEWFEAGEMPELTPVQTLAYVDIDSGHWPMTSAPAALADVVDGIARGSAGV